MTRLYAAQFVMVEERIWPDRREEARYLDLILFAADDDSAAYDRAVAMAAGLGDETHDRDAPRTRYYSPGIHELECVFEGDPAALEADLRAAYGMGLGTTRGPIEPRAREALALFKP